MIFFVILDFFPNFAPSNNLNNYSYGKKDIKITGH